MKQNQAGSIYVIEGYHGVKIGASSQPNKRIHEIIMAAGIANPLVFVSQTTSKLCELELRLHKKFSSKRIVGEWFYVTISEAVEAFFQECESCPEPPKNEYPDCRRKLSDLSLEQIDTLKKDLLSDVKLHGNLSLSSRRNNVTPILVKRIMKRDKCFADSICQHTKPPIYNLGYRNFEY